MSTTTQSESKLDEFTITQDAVFKDNYWVDAIGHISNAPKAVEQFIAYYNAFATPKTSYIFRDCESLAKAIFNTREMSAPNTKPSIWMLRGKEATCPVLRDGRIESAQVRMVVQHPTTEEKYMVYMHDKSKKFATPLGGTAEPHGYSIGTGEYRARMVARREVQEESAGHMNGKANYYEGIQLGTLWPFAKLQFESKYYGLDVPDTCWQFWTERVDHDFVQELFSEAPSSSGCYFATYHDHPETNWIAAVPFRSLAARASDVENGTFQGPLELKDGIIVSNLQVMLDSVVMLQLYQQNTTRPFMMLNELRAKGAFSSSLRKIIPFEQCDTRHDPRRPITILSSPGSIAVSSKKTLFPKIMVPILWGLLAALASDYLRVRYLCLGAAMLSLGLCVPWSAIFRR